MSDQAKAAGKARPYEEFGRRLALARTRRGFTVARRFAERIGVSAPRLSSWETGVAFPNDLEPFKRTCDILGVTADFLLFGEPRGLTSEAYRAIVLVDDQRTPPTER